MPGCRMTVGVIGAVAPYGDMRPCEILVERHPYLHCYCGDRLWRGQTSHGAPILVCSTCRAIADQRRVP